MVMPDFNALGQDPLKASYLSFDAAERLFWKCIVIQSTLAARLLVLRNGNTEQRGTLTNSVKEGQWKIIDSKELAKRWGVPETWIRECVRSRTDDPLPHVRFGKYVRFEWDHQNWMPGMQGEKSPARSPRSAGRAVDSYYYMCINNCGVRHETEQIGASEESCE